MPFSREIISLKFFMKDCMPSASCFLNGVFANNPRNRSLFETENTNAQGIFKFYSHHVLRKPDGPLYFWYCTIVLGPIRFHNYVYSKAVALVFYLRNFFNILSSGTIEFSSFCQFLISSMFSVLYYQDYRNESWE